MAPHKDQRPDDREASSLRTSLSLLAASGMLTFTCLPGISAADDHPPTQGCVLCSTAGSSGQNGVTVTVESPGAPSAAAQSTAGLGAPGGDAAPPNTVYDLRPICASSAAGDAICSTAYTCPKPDEYKAYVWSAPSAAGPWTNTRQIVCTGGTPGQPPAVTRPPTDAEITGALDATHLPITAPQLAVEPANPAVTQLPAILSTQPQQAHDETRTVLGVPITIHLTPSWHWNTGDSTFDSTTSGTPYDGTDPQHDPAHYLLWTWHTTGTRPVSVTVTWTATATRGDTGTTLTLPGTTVRTGTRDIPVREGRAHLTG